MKTILTFIAILMLGTTVLTAQNEFACGYDDAGNRTSRTVVYIPPAAHKPEEAQPLIVTEHVGEMEISIFPNPVKESLQLEITNMEEGNNRLKVLDLTGKVLIEQDNLSESVTVDFSALSPGQYIMQLFIGNKRKEYKVVKE